MCKQHITKFGCRTEGSPNGLLALRGARNASILYSVATYYKIIFVLR